MEQLDYLKLGSILLEGEHASLKPVLLSSLRLVSRKILHQRVFPLLKSKLLSHNHLIFQDILLIPLLKYQILKSKIKKHRAARNKLRLNRNYEREVQLRNLINNLLPNHNQNLALQLSKLQKKYNTIKSKDLETVQNQRVHLMGHNLMI